MSAYIEHIQPIVPSNRYSQEEALELMKEFVPGDEITPRLLHRIYTQSGIEQRYSVLDDFRKPLTFNGPFLTKADEALHLPTTKTRNDLYTKHAKELLADVTNEALTTNGTNPEEITHLITVSCTGFFAPGPDYHIIKACGLSPSVERTHIGFMGCFAAFPALKMARRIAESEPGSKTLIVCLELCTLHLQFKNEMDFLISGSVFADGGAAVIVGDDQVKGKIELQDFRSIITNEGENDMAWMIGEHGFDMKLSTYVPTILESNMESVVEHQLQSSGLSADDIDLWAIHPGGRAILDKTKKALGLEEEQLTDSRNVLRQYGNMSSVTILFVLREMLDQQRKGQAFASAFGPGLTVESGIMNLL